MKLIDIGGMKNMKKGVNTHKLCLLHDYGLYNWLKINVSVCVCSVALYM